MEGSSAGRPLPGAGVASAGPSDTPIAPADPLRTLYAWSVRTRRSVATWKREESRVLWPLVGFFVVFLIGTEVIAALSYVVVSGRGSSVPLVLAALDLAPVLIAVAAGVLLYLFFRSRNRRLDRSMELPVETPATLPENLLEASLAELETTDRALTSIHRRLWWIVFLACWLSLIVGEFAAGFLWSAYLALSGATVSNGFVPFAVTYGLGLGTAAVLILANALYWRRVERRIGELRAGLRERRAAITAFERSVWERV